MRAKSPAPPPLLEDLVATSVENDLRAIADEMVLYNIIMIGKAVLVFLII